MLHMFCVLKAVNVGMCSWVSVYHLAATPSM